VEIHGNRFGVTRKLLIERNRNSTYWGTLRNGACPER
jgi:hypothetical protein